MTAIRECLRAWGQAEVGRYCYSRSDRSHHMLSHAMEIAPGTKERAERKLIGRNGLDRRELMAQGSGVQGMRAIPMWACDPIRAKNDADPPHDRPEIAVDTGIPESLRWVERAILGLRRQSDLQAVIVRTEYTVSASQGVKAHMVSQETGLKLSKWQYRRELALAEAWLAGQTNR
jgi:hypothetical protein